MSDAQSAAGLHYTGGAGALYHQERAAWRTQEGQASRRRYFDGATDDVDCVLDFGCGVGLILAGLPARRRIGVEISEAAAHQAQSNLDEVHGSLEAIPDGSIDVVISFHALEHVGSPLDTLAQMRRVLKRGGRCRLVVPFDNAIFARNQLRWQAHDRDMHLYSWTPKTLGNLLSVAGFNVAGARLIPFTDGGRLARIPGFESTARWIKAAKDRRFQVVVDATADGAN